MLTGSEKPSTPAAGLFVSLDGRHDAIRAAARRLGESGDARVISFSELWAQARQTRGARPAFLAAVGSPPDREIGYGLVALAALALRPRRVVIVDTTRQRIVSRPLARQLADGAIASAVNLAASGTAVLAQRLAAEWLTRTPAPPPRRRGPRLGRLAYLRPLGGYGSAVGGSVTHTLEVVGALTGEGVEVDCATTDRQIVATAERQGAERPAWRLVDHPRIFNAVPASYAFAGDLALLLAAWRDARRADAVYQRHARFSMAGALVARLARRPLFLEYNSPGNFLASDPAVFAEQRERCERATLRTAARVVVVSEAAREILAGQGVDPGRIVVNPNGVDAERFAAASASASSGRAALSVGTDDFVVGFTGTFLPFHGVPVLAQAFCDLAARRPDARLLLVGDGEGLVEVEEILRAGGCEDRALLLGSVERQRIPELLAACDVLVSPHVGFADGTPFFGSPTKLFEYMAAGRAIVASRLGQIGDVLEHERTALLTPPGDADALAAALERLAGDVELRERLGRAANEEAAARHTWRHNARRLLRAYEELAPAARD